MFLGWDAHFCSRNNVSSSIAQDIDVVSYGKSTLIRVSMTFTVGLWMCQGSYCVILLGSNRAGPKMHPGEPGLFRD